MSWIVCLVWWHLELWIDRVRYEANTSGTVSGVNTFCYRFTRLNCKNVKGRTLCVVCHHAADHSLFWVTADGIALALPDFAWITPSHNHTHHQFLWWQWPFDCDNKTQHILLSIQINSQSTIRKLCTFHLTYYGKISRLNNDFQPPNSNIHYFENMVSISAWLTYCITTMTT